MTDTDPALRALDYGESRETLTTSEVAERETRDELARFELVERYIRGLQWSADVPEPVRTLVAGNLRGFASWLAAAEAAPPSDADVERTVDDIPDTETAGEAG